MNIKEAAHRWLICPNCESDKIHQGETLDPRPHATVRMIRILICEDCGYTINEGFTKKDIIKKAKELVAKDIDA